MDENVKQNSELKGVGLLQEGVHRPNLEKLVAFAEELDDDGTLIPAFLSILEMCFQG